MWPKPEPVRHNKIPASVRQVCAMPVLYNYKSLLVPAPSFSDSTLHGHNRAKVSLHLIKLELSVV